MRIPGLAQNYQKNRGSFQNIHFQEFEVNLKICIWLHLEKYTPPFRSENIRRRRVHFKTCSFRTYISVPSRWPRFTVVVVTWHRFVRAEHGRDGGGDGGVDVCKRCNLRKARTAYIEPMDSLWIYHGQRYCTFPFGGAGAAHSSSIQDGSWRDGACAPGRPLGNGRARLA